MNNQEESDVPFRHNSEASAHGVVLCVEVDHSCAITGSVEQDLMSWLTEGLQRAHGEFDADNLWHYVCGVRHDQWQGEILQLNGLQVTVHFATDLSDGYEWPLFHGGQAERVRVDAADVMASFGAAPACVRALGVSAVPLRTVIQEWAETIQQEPDSFCRAGLGYRRHHMYTLHSSFARENPIECEEMSSTFHWPDYPGARGETW